MKERRTQEARGLGWSHGALSVQRLGGMLAPVVFVLPDGKQVAPMHIAPWTGETAARDQPGILQRLRGEWPCVPFGYSVPGDGFPPDWARIMGPAAADEEIHGHSSNVEWDRVDAAEGSVALRVDYPEASPVVRLERTVTPDPDAPAVDISLRVTIRSECRLPLGIHATFRLPQAPGSARIEPGAFSKGRTYPGTVEPEAPLFATDARFERLDAVATRNGARIDAASVPFDFPAEELLQLDGIAGSSALAHLDEGWRVRLDWNPRHFPSLLLWYSNRGRRAPPWNGRHLALGMEPVRSPFGLGPDAARADNPVALDGTPTVRSFAAGEIFETRYRLSVEPLET